MPPSRLFHAVVVMGASLAPLAGCAEVPEGPCNPATANCPDEPDGGDHDGATDHDAGWPPTK